MFAIYFLASGLAVLAAFGLPMEPRTRLFMYFPIGLSVFGVFGASPTICPSSTRRGCAAPAPASATTPAA